MKMFEGYNILEQCRTGVTALERGGMHQHIQKPPQEVRSVQLPRRAQDGHNYIAFPLRVSER